MQKEKTLRQLNVTERSGVEDQKDESEQIGKEIEEKSLLEDIETKVEDESLEKKEDDTRSKFFNSIVLHYKYYTGEFLASYRCEINVKLLSGTTTLMKTIQIQMGTTKIEKDVMHQGTRMKTIGRIQEEMKS